MFSQTSASRLGEEFGTQIADEGTSYFITTHLGTTRVLADASGSIVSTLAYDSFVNVSSGSASTRYTYNGREADSSTKLMFYRARWYDPQQGSSWRAIAS